MLINMSLEEFLENWSACHHWLKVSKPRIELVGLLFPRYANFCKILQLPRLEFSCFFKVGLWWYEAVLQYPCKVVVFLSSLNIPIRIIRYQIVKE